MGQGLDLQGPRGSRGKPKRSAGVKWWANSYRVPGGQGVGLQGPRGLRGRPKVSQGGQRVGLQGPRGTRQGVGLQGIEDWAYRVPGG